MADVTNLPADLPVPEDDGGARHLPGARLPALTLEATDGRQVRLDQVGQGRWVLFVYPRTGRPGVALPEGWDEIPGARGCTPEACGFRDNLEALRAAGAEEILGLSAQDTDYQREAVDRLRLPYALLSDAGLALGEALGLPTFTAGGMTLYKRLTMVVSGAAVEHVFYPVFPPDTHADEVLAWLRSAPEPGRHPSAEV
jgi:peroxiredoxin